MKKTLRQSGISIIGEIPYGTHFCQFYQTNEDLMDLLIPYLKAGLEGNELCIWILSGPLSVEEAKEALEKTIPCFDVYLRREQIKIISSTNWYGKNSIFDSELVLNNLFEKANDSVANDYSCLRLFENISWLQRKSWSNFINYQKKMNFITDRTPLIALCAYPLDLCSETDIMDIVANHQFVLVKKNDKWQQIENSGSSNNRCERAEQRLKESEERYRILFTNMTDGFGLVEVIYKDDKPYDYRYLEVNPAFELSLGVKKEQLLGKTMLETFANVNPVALEKYCKVALSGQPTHFEIFSLIADKYLDIYVFSPEKEKLAFILRDITERKQFEKELQKSEKKFRNIVETASEGIWVGDTEARTIYVNKKLTDMLGYTRDEMLGRFEWDFADEEDKPTIKMNIERREQGIDESYEFKFLRKNGLPVWTIVNSKSLFDSNGKFIGSMDMLTDITERKEVEARLKETLDNLENLVKERTAELENAYNSLKESEKSLAEAQKMAHVGNWEWNIRIEKSYWSDELYRIFGRDLQDPYPTYQEFLDYIHPDDKEYVNNAAERAMSGKPYSIDYRIVLDNGEERTLHMQSEIIFDENKIPIQIKGIVQDITERKLAQEKLQESEERYRSFIENFKGIAFEADEQFIPVFLHGTVEEITGYSEEEFMSRQPWKEIIHPDDLSHIYEEEKRVRNSLYKAYGEIDFRIIRRDGKIKWLHEIYQKVPGKDGTPDKYQGAIYDITERKQAEENLEKIEKIRIKEIHHRIKNNLQVISSLLDLQAEAFSNFEVCKTPEVVEAFMESQSRVISMALIHEELYKGDKIDTLDFAAYLKKLTGNLFDSYNPGNMDVSFKLNLEKVNLNMDTAIPLGIIVNELISNSFKHAFPVERKGEIQINLSKSEISTSSNHIFYQDKKCMEKKYFTYILEVSDNGIGIPEEIDFENSDSLGLQLVKILVEQIDGCIELKREPKTNFTIWFSDTEK